MSARPLAPTGTERRAMSRAGDRFHLAVASDRALDAFYHPFAYAA